MGDSYVSNCDVIQARIRASDYSWFPVLSSFLGSKFTKVKDHVLFIFVIPIMWHILCVEKMLRSIERIIMCLALFNSPDNSKRKYICLFFTDKKTETENLTELLSDELNINLYLYYSRLSSCFTAVIIVWQ